MRKSLWTLIAIGMLAAIDSAPAAAANYPFCIKGCDFGDGVGDCSFSTYQQCQASASGRTATCAANPFYSASAELRPARGRYSQRRY